MRHAHSTRSIYLTVWSLVMGIAVMADTVTKSDVTHCTTNRLFQRINGQIDQLIRGPIKNNQLPLFTDLYTNAAQGVFIKNVHCWATTLDLSSCSVWTSRGTSHPTGTLITPKHILTATHYPVHPGTDLTFISKEGQPIIRKVLRTKQLSFKQKQYPDLTVGVLDKAIPSELVTPASILPANYKQFIGQGKGLPCIWLSQHKEAKLGDVALLDGVSVVTFPPTDEIRMRYYKRIVEYDSGSPVYMIVDGHTVVLTVLTRGNQHGAGTSIADFEKELNGLIEDLSPGCGFTLHCIDLKTLP